MRADAGFDRLAKEILVRATLPLLAIGLSSGWLQLGCQPKPPPTIAIPADTRGNPHVTYERDPVKPMPRPRESGEIAAPQNQPPSQYDSPPQLSTPPATNP